MALFSGKRLVWQAFAAGVVISASLAAQPVVAADDLPVVDDIRAPAPPLVDEEVAPLPPRYYAPAPHMQRPYAPDVYERESYVAPPIRVERTALYPRPVLPPYQVATIVRSSGYVPLGPVSRRGWVYSMAVAGPRGIEGRLVIDARTGRIMRFAPALAVGDALAYGPPPGPPLYQQDYRRAPRPPAPVPHVAKGHGAAPKVASQPPSPTPVPAATASNSSEAAKTPATPEAQQPAAPPAVERPAAAAPLDKTAEAKPAATVGTTAPSPAPAPTASTLKLWPTQAMPPVQPLN